MSTKRSILQNTLAQVMGKVITMGTTIIVTAIITRDLGMSGYGQFVLIMGFVALFYIIADFGLNAVTAREMVVDEGKTAEYLKALIIIRIGLSLFLMLLAFQILVFLPYSGVVKAGIMYALLTVLTQSLVTSINAVFQTRLQYHWAAVALAISSAFLLIYALLVNRFVTGDPLLWYVWGFVGQGVVTVLVSFYLVRDLNRALNVKISPSMFKSLFYTALPLGLMMIFAQIHGKADIILLSLLKLPAQYGLTTNETLGIYGLGYKVFEVVLVFATFFMNAAYPVLIRKFDESFEGLQKTFRTVTWFLLGCGIFATIFLELTSEPIIHLLGGEDLDYAVVTLRLLSVGLPIFFVSSAFQWYLVTLRQEKILPLIYAVGATITVTLNLLLIPRYSFVAAAILTWSVEFLILLMMVLFVGRFWHHRTSGVKR